MADSKITALTAISTVDPTADPLVIVDVSDTSMAASGTTKKSTINQLLGSGGTATLASATITGAATVGTTLGVTGAATVGTTLLVGTNATLTNGNVILGTSGKGIDFSATASGSGTMTSELLNDYEEGSWTPVVADASTGGNTGTCTINSAKYVKIGRQVSVQCDISGITTTGMTAGNPFYIRGLPFTSVQGGDGNFYTYRVGRDAATVSASAHVSDASSVVGFFLYTTNSATTDKTLIVSNIVSTTSQIILSVTYFV